MSRKEFVLKLVMELEKWGNEGSSVYHARHLAPFIERLLAQARKKVRESCASAVIGVSMAPSEMSNDRLMLAQDVRRRCVETIRQLDLTKLDEGGEDKG